MTTTTDYTYEDDRVMEIPRACRRLFNALVNVVLLGAPLSNAIDMAMSDPLTAILLKNHLQAGLGDDIEDDGTILGRRLRPRVLNALRPMVARIEARRVMDEIEAGEIENHGDEKMIHDAEPILAREEGNDAEKSRCEPVNPDAGHKPQWV
jgi:hypothetical protein